MRRAKRRTFVVSKVAAEHKNYESAAKSIDETLEKMGLDYLDMMIIHSPQPWVEVNQVLCHISNTPLELMEFCRKMILQLRHIPQSHMARF